MRRALAILCAAVALACAPEAGATPAYPPNPIGSYGADRLQVPAGIAVNTLGESYVVSSGAYRIEKFSRAGTHMLGWGGVGSGPGQFQFPYGIALGPDGTVYVLDVNLDRVQRFSPTGVLLGQFGTNGSGNGQMFGARGIAVGPEGDVYVADTFNHRVQKFSATGTYLAQWGTEGANDGQLKYPYGIGVDARGDVYVADTFNHRIQKFNASGTFLKKWGAEGTGDGQFEYPAAVHVDMGQNVYVADVNNRRVQRFTSTGVLLSLWGTLGSAEGEFNDPLGVGVAPNGDVHVTDSINNRVQTFRRRQGQGHEPLLAFGSAGVGNGQFMDICGVAVGKDGSIYVVDKAGIRVQKFTSFGAWNGAWGAFGDGDGEFYNPAGVAVDTSGFVYVTDNILGRVQKFTPNGVFVERWGQLGNQPGDFTEPWDIAIDDSNRVYVMDTHQVMRFTTDGTYLTSFTAPGGTGVGVDKEGYVYAACTLDHKVRKFSPDGTLMLSWGSFGNGIGQFDTPADVACDSAGYVYVADASGRVQQFTPLGGYTEEWGTPGTALRELGDPRMMAVDPAGNVYISELSNHRVQKFASPPEIVRLMDVSNDEGGFVEITYTRSSAEASPGGELYMYRILRFTPPTGLVATFPPGGSTTLVVPTAANATETRAGLVEFEIQGLLAVPGVPGLRSNVYGFSIDDLAPPVPSPFTGVYEAGATHLHWGVSPALDLAEYRLYRNANPAPIHVSPDTGYADVGPAGGTYAITAADTSGNVSAAATLGPEQTVDTPPVALEFRLDEVVPNPSRSPLVRFVLPDAEPATLQLVSVAGRSVWSREVRGAGTHAIRAGEGRTLAPGIYLVRLTRGAHSLVRRAVVLD
jgi:DNA-binding beta-propeller fold protein YncE